MPNLIHLAEWTVGPTVTAFVLAWTWQWLHYRGDYQAGIQRGGTNGYQHGRAEGYREAFAEIEREKLAQMKPAEYEATHTIYHALEPEALGAEDVPRPDQAPIRGVGEPTGPGHLESTQEWQARMDLEAAQWCARHGLRHESAWAA